MLLLGVQHEMLEDHLTLNQCVHIELPLEDRLYQPTLLDSSEPLVLCPARISELNILILILQLDNQLLILSSFVQYVVTEINQHNQFALRILGMPEFLPSQILVLVILLRLKFFQVSLSFLKINELGEQLFFFTCEI